MKNVQLLRRPLQDQAATSISAFRRLAWRCFQLGKVNLVTLWDKNLHFHTDWIINLHVSHPRKWICKWLRRSSKVGSLTPLLEPSLLHWLHLLNWCESPRLQVSSLEVSSLQVTSLQVSSLWPWPLNCTTCLRRKGCFGQWILWNLL